MSEHLPSSSTRSAQQTLDPRGSWSFCARTGAAKFSRGRDARDVKEGEAGGVEPGEAVDASARSHSGSHLIANVSCNKGQPSENPSSSSAKSAQQTLAFAEASAAKVAACLGVEAGEEEAGVGHGDCEYQELHSPKSVGHGAFAANSTAHAGNCRDAKGMTGTRLPFRPSEMWLPFTASSRATVRVAMWGVGVRERGEERVVDGVRSAKVSASAAAAAAAAAAASPSPAISRLSLAALTMEATVGDRGQGEEQAVDGVRIESASIALVSTAPLSPWATACVLLTVGRQAADTGLSLWKKFCCRASASGKIGHEMLLDNTFFCSKATTATGL
mmetsp:Transcript_5682/g.15633  ORF Transcript_5682/g.15633 Transcript_5682/m.15633 type:complete len:331 (+) Transcript_5682:277-1269(+)